MTFAVYAANWLAGFIDAAPDRAWFEAALEHRLLPVFGELPLLEVLEADRDDMERRSVDAVGGGDDGAARECLRLIVEDAAGELCAGALAAVAQVRQGRPSHHPVASIVAAC